MKTSPLWTAALAALLTLGACSRAPVSDSAPDAAGFIGYADPAGGFRCRLPADWKVQAARDGSQRLSVFGPPGGSQPYSASISIYRHSAPETVENFLGSEQAAAAESMQPAPAVWKKARGLVFSTRDQHPPLHGRGETTMIAQRTALIPFAGGFLAVIFTAPAGDAALTAPVFQTVLDSIEPKL